MDSPKPYIDPDEDDPARPVCGICPSKRLPREAFVIYERPNRDTKFNEADGYRYTAEGTPACVHPHKIGLEPDRKAPESVPESPQETVEATKPARRKSRWSFLGR
jgi:hypothetical protein